MTIFWRKIIFAFIVGSIAGLVSESVAVGAAVFAAFLMFLWVPIYVNYAKDNPQHFWFKRKLFGWGWTPVTWQGWLVVLVYIGLVILFGMTVDESSPPREVAFTFILPVLFFTILLIRIAYKNGEKPKWEWGKDIAKYQ